jgi:hypothetical protein
MQPRLFGFRWDREFLRRLCNGNAEARGLRRLLVRLAQPPQSMYGLLLARETLLVRELRADDVVWW